VRDRRRLVRRLRSQVDLAGHERDARPALQIQPLFRICGSASYEHFKQEQEAAWLKQGGRYTTASWPREIAEGELAAVLLPLAAGRVGSGVGRHPRAIATPRFTHGRPIEEGNVADLGLSLLVTWLDADISTAIPAPPVLEVIQRGRSVERRVVDFGLRWPLPAPDGV
jgi:hypothetical protein